MDRQLVAILPETALHAQRARGQNGGAATKLAQLALFHFAKHPGYASSAKVRRRWGAEDGRFFDSPKFHEDAADLASEIHLLMSDPSLYAGEDFAHGIVRSMYRLLKLRHPFKAEEEKRRRSR